VQAKAPLKSEIPTRDVICAQTVDVSADAPKAVPFTRPAGRCRNPDTKAIGECMWEGRFDAPPTPADTCFVAQSNIDDASRRVRTAAPFRPAPRPAGTAMMSSFGPEPMPMPRSAGTPWDGRTQPKFAKKVTEHLGLGAHEQALLEKNHFVVLARRPVHSYVAAYHDIFQEQLPLYVSADSIFHAVFRSEDVILEGLEDAELKPLTGTLLDKLRAALRTVPRSETALDVDLYLTVAAKLAAPSWDGREQVHTTFGTQDAEVAALVEKINAGTGIDSVSLYGRERAVDFSAYVPVGHYGAQRPGAGLSANGKPSLTGPEYFRTITWLGRHEWNLVSRGCQSSTPLDVPCSTTETPREARAALLLAHLIDLSGARPILDRFEAVYSAFGGQRDDVPVAALKSLVAPAGYAQPQAPENLRAAIGDRYKRFAVTHPMPVFSGDHDGRLPAIATLIGARIAPELDATGSVMRAAFPDKMTADHLATLLGHDPAARTSVPSPAHAEAQKNALALREAANKGSSLYDAWLGAVLALSDAPVGVVPSFARTKAHADLRMNSAVVAYAQIRHNFVAMTGMSYDSYGCEIPDAYVEPQLAAYEALLRYAERGETRASRNKETVDYFRRTATVLRTLIAITKHELAGVPLTPQELRFLGMVAEYTPVGGYAGDSHGPPQRTGWYFDLFPDRARYAEMSADLVGEIAVNAHSNYAFVVGAQAPNLAVFVVDVGGEPRMMVGPVAAGYEDTRPLAERRWTDNEAWKLSHPSPWTKSYTAPVGEQPSVEGTTAECDDGSLRVFVRSLVPMPDAQLVFTDHHGDSNSVVVSVPMRPEGAVVAVTARPAKPPAQRASMGFPDPQPASPFAGLRLQFAAHTDERRQVPPTSLVLGPSVYHSLTGGADYIDDTAGEGPHVPRPMRYRDLGYFALGRLSDVEPPAHETSRPQSPMGPGGF
jgi:hypothetical protein